MVAVISVYAYLFLAFSDLTCHLEDTGMFSGCTVLPYSEETELGNSGHKSFSSAGKNTGVASVPCSCMEVRPYSYFQRCGYF